MNNNDSDQMKQLSELLENVNLLEETLNTDQPTNSDEFLMREETARHQAPQYMDQWQQNRYQTVSVGNVGMRQPNPQLVKQKHSVDLNFHSQPWPILKQALIQLLPIIRSPNYPEKQQHIMEILKSNPDLMAFFVMKKRGFQQMLQHQ